MAIILRTQSACMATHNIPYKAAARSHNSVLPGPTSRTPGHPVPVHTLSIASNSSSDYTKTAETQVHRVFFPFTKDGLRGPGALSSRVIYCLFLSTFRCCCCFFSIFATRSSPSPSIVVNHHPFSGKKKKQTFLLKTPTPFVLVHRPQSTETA